MCIRDSLKELGLVVDVVAVDGEQPAGTVISTSPGPGSTAEQGSAGLGALSAEELARFERLNAAYRARFDLPFVMAIKGSGREAILTAFEARLRNDPEQEFQEALRQIERIAWLRLKDRLPSAG